jgi:hypothetical protein
MKTILRSALLIAAIAGASFLAACGGGTGVSGYTYAVASGGYQIQFQSGGKAVETMGPITGTCTYVEDAKSVTLTCDVSKTVFTINDKGQLLAPSDSMLSAMGPLSRK